MISEKRFREELEAWRKERMDLLAFFAEQARSWADERRELLNRVQRPDFVPQRVPEGWEAPEPEPDFSNLVGTIAEPDADE